MVLTRFADDARPGGGRGARWVAALGAAALLLPAVAAADPVGPRGYEQVTPIFKNGAGFGAVGSTPATGFTSPVGVASRDGERVLAQSQVGFGDPGSATTLTEYLFDRRDTGWATTVLSPALPAGPNGAPFGSHSIAEYGASDDLRSLAFTSPYVIDPERDQDRGGNAGDTDVYRYSADRGLELASCLPSPAPPCAAQTSAVIASSPTAMSSDGGRVLFETDEPLVPGASGFQVYDRSGDTVRWISQPLDTPLPAGATQVTADPSAIVSSAASSGNYGPGTSTTQWPNAIRPDGARVFFSAPSGTTTARLYVRIDGSKTLEVSRVRGGTGAASGVVPQGASEDGNLAFFTTAQKLLPSSGGGETAIDPNTVADLYAWRYDPATSDETLIRVTGLPQVGGGPAADNAGPTTGTAPNNQRFENVIGRSDDGSRVYFITRSATFSSGSPGTINLYVAENPADPVNGVIRFIATVFTGTSFSQTTTTCLAPNFRDPYSICGRATQDGRFATFESRLPLTSDDVDTDGATTCTAPPTAIPAVCKSDTFVYDDVNHVLARASIGDGAADGPRGNGQADAGLRTSGSAYTRQLNITDEGSVIFSTAESLVAADTNSVLDVYEYAHGAVTLISGGTGTDNSLYFGNSSDGRDIFFITTDGLVAQDGDGAPDLYDARVGGGFDEPQPQTCSALDGGCQAPPGFLPSATGPLVSTASGGQNAPPKAAPSLTVAKVTPAERAKLASTGALTLVATVTAPGQVAVEGRATLATRATVVARGSKSVNAAGPVRVRVTLTKAARRELAAKRRLTVSLSVAFSKAPGVRRQSLALALPKKQAKRRSAPAKRRSASARHRAATTTAKSR